MSYRVFISHGSADRWVAEQIRRRLEELPGATAFLDVFEIEKGDEFEDVIFEEMRGCSELLLLMTPWSIQRKWLWAEAGAARMLRLRIVPVLYGVTLDRLERSGGAAFLRTRSVMDINDLDSYFEEVAARAGSAAAERPIE